MGQSSSRAGIVQCVRLLIAAHVLLAAVPLGEVFLLDDMAYLPIRWVFAAIHLGQLMLLGLWAGLGGTELRWRLVITVVTCAYLAGCRSMVPEAMFMEILAVYVVIVLVLGGACLPLRRVVVLRHQPEAPDEATASRWQFSILAMLIVAALVALVLALVHRAQPSPESPGRSQFAAQALGLVAITINALVAASATMSVGRVGLRVSLAFLVSALLSATLVFSGGIWSVSWSLGLALALAFVLPTAIVVASLLVVRSCGYRLVRKRTAQAGALLGGDPPATTATI